MQKNILAERRQKVFIKIFYFFKYQISLILLLVLITVALLSLFSLLLSSQLLLLFLSPLLLMFLLFLVLSRFTLLSFWPICLLFREKQPPDEMSNVSLLIFSKVSICNSFYLPYYIISTLRSLK